MEGKCHKIFYFRLSRFSFHESSFPGPLILPIIIILNFIFGKSQRYLQLKVHQRCHDSCSRVRPFCLKFFFASKRNKAKLDPFHMCFTISLNNFTSLFSLLFAYFRFKFFASLHYSNFHLEVKQSIAPPAPPVSNPGPEAVPLPVSPPKLPVSPPPLPVSPPPLPDSFTAEQQRRQQRSIAIVTRL